MGGEALRVGLCHDTNVLARSGYPSSFESVDVLLFPELADGGYAALYRGAKPRRLDHPAVLQFRRASKKFSFYCIAGTMYLQYSSSRPTNTSLVFHRGRLVHRYDKIHLFRPTNDHRYFRRGNRISTFSISRRSFTLRAGVVICYDLRFPELVRSMALRGMAVLFVPARWPSARDDAWYTLLKARAIENQIFVVGCNALGKEGGYSYSFDPLGRCIFSNKTGTQRHFASFLLDMTTIAHARSFHQNLKEAVLL